MDRKKAADLAYAEGYRLGAASRDAEVNGINQRLDLLSEASLNITKERDQLREQVKMLRDALQRIANRFDLGNGKCCGASEQHTYNEATEALAATEPKP